MSANIVETLHHDTYPAINPAQWDFFGKAVLVTGASRGIGKATALSFARAGASYIIISARSSGDLDEVEAEVLKAAHDAGRKAPTVVKAIMDVADPKSVEATAKVVRETVGRLDVLLNNAGFLELAATITEGDQEEWWTTWTVNIRGTYLVTRAFLPLMLETEGDAKVVVNVSSVVAVGSPGPGFSAYNSSKLALIRFTEFIELEYGTKGIVPVVIHPGGVMTAMGHRVPDYIQKFLIDKPELAADFIVWLSKDRKDWLSGRYVSCNWDIAELEAKKEEIVKGDKLKVRLVI